MSPRKNITVRKWGLNDDSFKRTIKGPPGQSGGKEKQQLVKLDKLESDAASGLLLLGVCILKEEHCS